MNFMIALMTAYIQVSMDSTRLYKVLWYVFHFMRLNERRKVMVTNRLQLSYDFAMLCKPKYFFFALLCLNSFSQNPPNVVYSQI